MASTDRYRGGLALIVQCGDCRHNRFYEFVLGEDTADDCARCGGPLLVLAVLNPTAEARAEPTGDVTVNVEMGLHLSEATGTTVQSVVELIRDRLLS